MTQRVAGISTMQVARLSGATFRQLDYWARLGVLVPDGNGKGSGAFRSYEPWQARAALALRLLSDALGRVPTNTAIPSLVVERVREDPTTSAVHVRYGPMLLVLTLPLAPEWREKGEADADAYAGG